MQAKHPIDELFRGALAQAEAAPPAGLFDGVMAARAKRGRGAAWWRRTSVLVLIGGAIAGAFVHQHASTPVEMAALEMSPSQGPEVIAVSNAVALNTTTVFVPEEPPTIADGTIGNKGVVAMDEPVNAFPKGNGPNGTSSSNAAIVSVGRIPNEPPSTPSKAVINSSNSVPQEWSENNEDPTSMDPRISELPSLSSGAPVGAVRQQAFVLPKAEWWVGARIAALNENRTWSGDNTRLVEVLNGTETNSTYWSMGVIGGRTWRSGLNLGTGLLYERSERAFSTTYRSLLEEQEITTYFVTLNDQVFVSNVDTVVTTSMSENTVSGIHRRALVRVPLELGWRFDLKRWGIMPKAGLVLELNLQRQGLSLDQTTSDGPLMAVELDPDAMRQRHPDLLMAMVGAELSYLVGERWRLSAAPVFMWTATTLAPQGAEPKSIPQRSGLEFGLTYTFPGLK